MYSSNSLGSVVLTIFKLTKLIGRYIYIHRLHILVDIIYAIGLESINIF